MTHEEAIKNIREWDFLNDEEREAIETLIPELKESEDENLKNKSGYYRAGKFWRASTLWNAVRGKSPQRVPNRYILQECTWNISSLQHFADEVKNVYEVDLNYPIILDMNGNILDGAHRVVKAYLEGKDIDIVYLGDDEWPEPDYDEEKAVKKSEDERIKKIIRLALISSEDYLSAFYKTHNTTRKECTDWLEKQKDDKEDLIYRMNGLMQKYIEDTKDKAEKEHRLECYNLFWDALEDREFFKKKEQKPVAWNPTNDDVDLLNKAVTTNTTLTPSERAKLDIIRMKFKHCNRNIIKPVEWIEEDEKKLRLVIDCIYKFYPDPGMKYGLKNWLKSLRPQPKENSKCEDYPNRGNTHQYLKGSKDRNRDLALSFMAYLDENRPENKMCLSNAECEDIELAFQDMDWGKIIRYAEKYQPKQEWGEEDEKKAATDYANENPGLCFESDGSSWMGDFDKPYHDFLAGVLWAKSNVYSIKNIEWSEKEKIRKSLVEYFSKFNPADMWDNYFSISEILAFLEKQKEQFWKPSEQEKGALRTAIHILTDERNFPKAAAQLQNILDAFEGEESRKDWKPSEEQMTALEQAADLLVTDLNSLYNDLNKL